MIHTSFTIEALAFDETWIGPKSLTNLHLNIFHHLDTIWSLIEEDAVILEFSNCPQHKI